MLKVEIGYYDFIFPEEETTAAFSFAKTARDHFSKEDNKNTVSITFLNEEEETK